MNDYLLIQFFKQRMREMRYSSYHFEPVTVRVQLGELVVLNAYNDFYYLRSNEVQNIEITSDISYYHSNNPLQSNFQEFSGKIEITSANDLPVLLEFIRVIPTT